MKTARYGVAAAAIVVLVSSFGCAKKNEPAPAPAPAPAPPPVAAAISVSDVQLGNTIGADKKVLAPSTVFKPTDTIYASVTTAGSAPRATVTARFKYQDGQLVNESSQDLSGAGVTEF